MCDTRGTWSYTRVSVPCTVLPSRCPSIENNDIQSLESRWDGFSLSFFLSLHSLCTVLVSSILSPLAACVSVCVCMLLASKRKERQHSTWEREREREREREKVSGREGEKLSTSRKWVTSSVTTNGTREREEREWREREEREKRKVRQLSVYSSEDEWRNEWMYRQINWMAGGTKWITCMKGRRNGKKGQEKKWNQSHFWWSFFFAPFLFISPLFCSSCVSEWQWFFLCSILSHCSLLAAHKITPIISTIAIPMAMAMAMVVGPFSFLSLSLSLLPSLSTAPFAPFESLPSLKRQRSTGFARVCIHPFEEVHTEEGRQKTKDKRHKRRRKEWEEKEKEKQIKGKMREKVRERKREAGKHWQELHLQWLHVDLLRDFSLSLSLSRSLRYILSRWPACVFVFASQCVYLCGILFALALLPLYSRARRIVINFLVTPLA